MGISKNASFEEIKNAYKRLAKEYHPDINKSELGSKSFVEINEAYSILSDRIKKRNYDISISKINNRFSDHPNINRYQRYGTEKGYATENNHNEQSFHVDPYLAFSRRHSRYSNTESRIIQNHFGYSFAV